MSVLPAEVQGAISQLLQALSSNDNAIRSQAEVQLNEDWTANRADVLLMGLAEQVQGAAETSVSLRVKMLKGKSLTRIDAIFCRSPVPKTSLKVQEGSYRRVERAVPSAQQRR